MLVIKRTTNLIDEFAAHSHPAQQSADKTTAGSRLHSSKAVGGAGPRSAAHLSQQELEALALRRARSEDVHVFAAAVDDLCLAQPGESVSGGGTNPCL